MKICQFVSSSADTEYTRNLGLGLGRKGVRQLWVTLYASGKEEPNWIQNVENAEYLCLAATGRADFLAAVFRLAWTLRQRKIDIIQTHLYEASLVGLLAAKIARVPVKVLTRHHLDQTHMIGNRLPIMIDRWEARTANKVVVLGNAVKRFLIEKDGISSDKIHVIHQGFDFDRFRATEQDGRRVRDEFRIGENDFVIGTFGNFFPTKGHRFLLSAAASLITEIPNLKLFFVGDGGGKEAVIDQAAELGLSDRVIFAGFRNDVAACIKAVDVVVHPSLSEAFCQVLVETMSVGTPLISTDVGGAREVIDDGETALLIPAESPAAIVEAVTSLFKNPDLGKEIALSGQTIVRKRFTIEKMINQQIECYEAWLQPKKDGSRRTI